MRSPGPEYSTPLNDDANKMQPSVLCPEGVTRNPYCASPSPCSEARSDVGALAGGTDDNETDRDIYRPSPWQTQEGPPPFVLMMW